MQLKISNLESVSSRTRTDTNSKFKEHTDTPACLNTIKNINKMIVMSGTAKRKSFEKIVTGQNPVNCTKKHHHENFSKLRAPFYKSRQKQIQPAEKLMSKSCELLFEYLKPYKDIHIVKEKNSLKKEWNRTIGSILKTTNVVYQKTATREVEIFRVFEENSNYNFNKNNSIFDFLPSENKFILDCDNKSTREKNARVDRDSEVEENFNLLQKTVSSEDFINNVFSEPGIGFF